MKYLKVFTDFAKDTELLDDAEIGRLFRAMLLYAETEKETELCGNEKFLWGTAKKNIDNQRVIYKNKIDGAEKARSKKHVDINDNQVDIKEKNLISTQEKEKEKDKEKEYKEKVISYEITKKKKFVPPTMKQVKQYCKERGNNVDAAHFVDYYTANGWHVGKQNMKDWKAAVRTWERNNKNSNSSDRIAFITQAVTQGGSHDDRGSKGLYLPDVKLVDEL